MVFAAEGLPPGLTLDSATGQISGSLAARGEYRLRLTATNSRGTGTKDFRLKVGDSIALTPPLGWNSWNCWGEKVDQDKMLRAARALVASGLANHGWTYVNIDDGWQGRRSGPDHALQANQKFADLARLCAAIHALGLKSGIYSAPWVTSYAGFPGGSSDREDGAWSQDLADRSNRRLGRHSFAAADARQWAAAGFDYLKYDWQPIDVPHVAEMSRALRATGRDLVFSLSNTAPFDHAADFAQLANSWRTTGDVREHWSMPAEPRKFGVSESGFSQDRWAPFAGPGHWNDPDMLVIGEVGLGTPRPTYLTGDEQYSQVTLWCLLSAPLLIGCDLERLDPFTLGLLSNDEVLAVDQDALGQQAIRLAAFGPVDIYAKPLEDGGLAVGFFNRDAAAQSIDFAKLASLGLVGPQAVRDLWRQKNLAEIRNTATQALHLSLPAHGALLYKFTGNAHTRSAGSGSGSLQGFRARVGLGPRSLKASENAD